jgi:hypothetical protein
MYAFILLCQFCFHVISYWTKASVPAAVSPFPPRHWLVFVYITKSFGKFVAFSSLIGAMETLSNC